MPAAQQNRAVFEDLPVRTALRTMVVPTILSQLIVLIYNMADTFYVGRTNDPLMVAGVSLILPVFNITTCLAGLAGIGGGSLISRLLGQGREEEARRASRFSFYLCICTALCFSLGVGLGMTPLLRLLGATANTFDYARQYISCVIVLGAVPTVLSNVSANLLRSTGCSRQASTGIIAGGILNMILDPLFMFVLLPRGSEVLGVGIATLLSNCAACCYFFIVLFRQRRTSILTLDPRVPLPTAESIRSVFFVGIPSATATLLFDFDYIIIDRLMVSYSDIALAAVGIVLKVERLPLNVGLGICQGMLPLVAYSYAAKNHSRMSATIRDALTLGLLIAAGSVTLYELFAPSIIRFFISNADTAALATQFLRIRVLATPLMFLCFFTVYLFQAFGKGQISLFLGVFRWAALNIPMLFILNHFIGMFGLVWSQSAADALMAALSICIYTRYRRTAFPKE